MADNNQVKIKVDVDGAQGSAALGGITSKLRGLVQAGSAIPGVGSALLAVGSAAGVLAGVFAGASRALQEFAETEAGVAKLEAALANVGSSTEATRERIKGLSEELQSATGIADDRWLATLTKLIQAGADPRSVGMDVEAVKNLTGYVGNLETATSLYARAIQGNFEGLKRYGILIQEAGDNTQKLQALQEQAAQRGAGVLEAATHTLSGQFQRLKNASADAFEAVGQHVAKSGILSRALWGATEVLSAFASSTAEAYQGLGLLNKQTEGTAAATNRYRSEAEAVMRLTQESVKAIDSEIAALRSKEQILEQLAGKETALRKAGVDVQVATGQITPQEGIRRRAAIDIAAARDRAGREQGAATAEMAAQQERVRIIQDRKTAVDRDLATERKALARQDKLASIQTLVQSAMADRSAFTSAANSIVSLTPGGARQAAQFRDSTLEGLDQFGERMSSRVANNAPAIRARVAELESMSSTLGTDLAKERGTLSSLAAPAQARVIGARLDEATAITRAQTEIAGASRGEAGPGIDAIRRGADGAASNLAAAANGVAQTLQETAAYNAQVLTSLTQFRRELATMQLQIRNSANR